MTLERMNLLTVVMRKATKKPTRRQAKMVRSISEMQKLSGRTWRIKMKFLKFSNVLETQGTTTAQANTVTQDDYCRLQSTNNEFLGFVAFQFGKYSFRNLLFWRLTVFVAAVQRHMPLLHVLTIRSKLFKYLLPEHGSRINL